MVFWKSLPYNESMDTKARAHLMVRVSAQGSPSKKGFFIVPMANRVSGEHEGIGGEFMTHSDRITLATEVLDGKPVIKGTRIAVAFIVELLAQGWTHEDILQNYPGLTLEDILACLSYASSVLQEEKVYPMEPNV